MNWETAGAVGEILAAIVVAITLIYLAIQTRLNKKAMESSAFSSIMQSWYNNHQLMIQSEEVALLHEKGQRDPNSLTKGEKLRFFMIVRVSVNAYSAMFQQYRSGQIDKQTWESVAFDIYVSQQGVRKYLNDQVHVYEQDFIEYVNSLEEYTVSDPVFLMTGGSANDT